MSFINQLSRNIICHQEYWFRMEAQAYRNRINDEFNGYFIGITENAQENLL